MADNNILDQLVALGRIMRVLHVIDSLNRGGAEVMLTAMAPRFRRRGITCDVVALLRRPSPLEQSLLDQDIYLRYSGVDRLYSPQQVFALAQVLRGYDIVHVHLFPAQLWTVLAAVRLKCRIPLVTTEHSTSNARRRWWLRPVDRWMYPHYERIACISEASAANLIEWCPNIAEKITVVPNGILLDAFETARPVMLEHVPPDVVRLVFVGRCEAPKDHATILRALTNVPDAHLIFVGDGPLRSRLEQMALSLGIRNRVTFLGWRRDVAAVLKASHIYVHSTHFDGFGIAACEAMAAGLPVVASDVPGLAQLVAGAGVLFPAGDDKALARALSALIKSPDQQREMSRASLQRARQFSIENTIDGCISMYESVLHGDTPRVAEVR
jgi:glycosyltransferase involved in cell wall biosynthesis